MKPTPVRRILMVLAIVLLLLVLVLFLNLLLFDQRQFIIGFGVLIFGIQHNRVFEHLHGFANGCFRRRQILRSSRWHGHRARHGRGRVGLMKQGIAAVIERAGLQPQIGSAAGGASEGLGGARQIARGICGHASVKVGRRRVQFGGRCRGSRIQKMAAGVHIIAGSK